MSPTFVVDRPEININNSPAGATGEILPANLDYNRAEIGEEMKTDL